MNLKLLVENTSPFDTDRAGTKFFAKRQQVVSVNTLGYKEIRACRVLKIISMEDTRATITASLAPTNTPVRKILEPQPQTETVEKTGYYSGQTSAPAKKPRTKTGGS
jgi:hypothetical protein